MSFIKSKFFKKNLDGFTLIELMVVIAIIAILAGGILVMLQSGRDAAYDSRKKSAISQIRSLAGVEYAINIIDGYSNLEGNKDVEKIREEYTDIVIYGDDSNYCAYVPLLAGDDAYFCVSNTQIPTVYENFNTDSCIIDGTNDSFICASQ